MSTPRSSSETLSRPATGAIGAECLRWVFGLLTPTDAIAYMEEHDLWAQSLRLPTGNDSIRDLIWLSIVKDVTPSGLRIGLSIFDMRALRDIQAHNPAAMNGNASSAIESHHYVIGNPTSRDSNPDHFLLRTIESLSTYQEVKRFLEERTRDRQVILVDHEPRRWSLVQQMRWLKGLDINLPIIDAIDIYLLTRSMFPVHRFTNLDSVLYALAIPHAETQVVGNRAHLILRAMLMLVFFEAHNIVGDARVPSWTANIRAIAQSTQPWSENNHMNNHRNGD